jgi:hypothetical protein
MIRKLDLREQYIIVYIREIMPTSFLGFFSCVFCVVKPCKQRKYKHFVEGKVSNRMENSSKLIVKEEIHSINILCRRQEVFRFPPLRFPNPL